MKIRDLQVGDGVDLESFPADYQFDEATRMAAEYQYAEITAGPTVESADTWVMHTDAGSFGVDPNWEVEANRP